MIEIDGVQSPTDQFSKIDTPSIAVANYNNQYNNMYGQQSLVATTSHTFTKNHIIHLKEASKNCNFELIQHLLHVLLLDLGSVV